MLHRPSGLRRAIGRTLAGAAIVVAATVVPIELVDAGPEIRLDEIPTTAADRRVDPSFPVTHVGVRWREPVGEAVLAGAAPELHEHAHVEVRWRTADGWSPWTEAEPSHDLGDEEAGIVLSGLIPVPAGAADEVEARVVDGGATDVSVVAIDAVHGPRRMVPASAARPAHAALDPAAKVEFPGVVTRAQWGADESMRSGPPSFGTISGLVVHHTAGAEGPDPAATVRAIYAYHTRSNGWADIGYNFLVDSRGRIYEGRWARDYGSAPHNGEDAQGRGVTGAHAAWNNTGSVGIALLGDFTNAAPTGAAIDGLVAMLAYKADRHDIDPFGSKTWSNGTRSTIIGHRDVGSTACPGSQLYPRLPEIRQRVADVISSAHGSTRGYWELSRDGRVFPFGQATKMPLAEESKPVVAPAVGIGSTRTGAGYWVLSGNGRVVPFGDAQFHGSTEAMRLNAPVVRIEPTPTGQGYWVLGSDGGVFSFGDAKFHGSTGGVRLNAPVISMASTPSGKGYWLLAADGGVFSFGDATFHGSTGGMKLNQPVVAMAPHPKGTGYWLVAKDGGIFTFGEARFRGSLPGLGVQTSSAIQIRATGSARGYYVLAEDGGIFTFGDARFHGAQSGLFGTSRASDLALLPDLPTT